MWGSQVNFLSKVKPRNVGSFFERQGINLGLRKGMEKVNFFNGMPYSRFFLGIGRSHGTGTKY